MSILVDENSLVLVQGITGREGSFHTLRNLAYGTRVVAGVTPGKGGAAVEGIPVFDTVAEAVEETGANVSLLFVPPAYAVDAIYEAIDGGVRLIVAITEGIPTHDVVEIYHYLRARGVRMVGPNCPGVISPGKANVGIMPPEIFSSGPVGIVSRSGTLTYEIANELTVHGLGQSTALGIGGDAVVGLGFTDVLGMFAGDPETEAVVMIGEIGGDEEELAAEFVAREMAKPVVAYVAGFTAPPGRQMGHAGAIVSGSSGTAQAKKEALEAVGVPVATTPGEVTELLLRSLRRD